MPDEYDVLLDSVLPKPRQAKSNYDDLIQKHATRTNLDPEFVRRVVGQESRGNTRARSFRGAQGLGQLMPGTAQRYNVKNPNDPDENLRGSTDYLRDLTAEFKEPEKVLAAYNAGEGRVRKLGYERTRKLSNLPKGDPRRGGYQGSTGEYVDRILQGYQKPQKKRDAYDDLLDEVVPAQQSAPRVPDEYDKLLDETISGQTPPATQSKLKRVTPQATASTPVGSRQASVPTATEALQKVMDDTNRIMSGIPKPKPQRLEVGAKVGGPQASQGVADLRRADDPETARINRIQQQVTAAQTPDERQMGRAPNTQDTRLLAPKLTENEEVLRRVSEEQGAERAQSDAQAERQRLTAQFTDADRAEIADFVNHLQGKGRVYTGARTGIRQAGSSALYKLAGLADIGNAVASRTVGESWIPDYLRKKALAGELSVNDIPQEKRNQLAEFLAQSGVGLAEVMAAPGGAVSKFAGLGAAEAQGRNLPASEVVRQAAKGAATGAVFEGAGQLAPEGAGMARRLATTVPTVGAGTAALELATGASPREAAVSGLTNAAFAGVGELGRWYHSDFGEVTESANQKRLGKGRVRVTDEDGVDHVIKKSALTGAGNQRAVPIKAEGSRVATPVEAELTSRLAKETTERRAAVRAAETDELTGVANQKAWLKAKPAIENDPNLVVLSGDLRNLKAANTFLKREGGDQAIKDAASAMKQAAQEAGENRIFRDSGDEILAAVPKEKAEAIRARAEELFQGRKAGKYDVRFDVGLGENRVTADADLKTRKTGESFRPLEETTAPTEVAPTEAPPPVETAPREPSTTAVKNASMQADRAALDLPELAQADPRKATEVHERAMEINTAKPRSVDRLVEQALEGDKNFTDVETAQVRLRAQEIKNRESELLKEIEATNDPAEIRDKRLELDSLTSEFDRLSQATKKAGTEWGRAGVARQQAIDQDFSLVAMKARVKAAKGEGLTADESAKIEDLHKRLTQAETERDAANERAAQAELQKSVDRVVRQRKRTETKATLDTEFAQLSQQFRAKMSVQAAGIDPTAIPIIAKMARNRVHAGVTDVAQLVDDIHAAISEHLPDVTKREVRDAISGYGLEPRSDKRGEAAKQLADIRTEMRNLSKAEDVAQGRRSPRQEGPKRDFTKNETRLRQLQAQEAELQRKMESGDFDKPERESPRYTRATYEAQRRVNDLKSEFEKLKYHATTPTGRKILHTAIGAGNIPKTLLSMGDVSALLRQGLIGVYQHPVLSGRAARDMMTSFTKHGFANVEEAIKNAKDSEGRSLYDLAKKSGVEFTGVDIDSPKLNRREEGYLGSGALDTLSQGRLNPLKYTLKPVKDFSERTFVSFLDSQRMRIFEQQAQALRDMGLKGKDFDAALKSQAKYINMITGRGSLGTEGNKLAPALNLLMFSPRLVASRIQFMNKVMNPFSWARTPKGARKLQMIDNAKFLVGAATTLALANAAIKSVTGENAVNLDPDDADFLKIKVGNTRFDTLGGLQQPMRFLLRMTKAIKGGETYAGDSKGKIAADFVRSKASPEIGLAWDWLEGKNRLSGEKVDLKSIGKSFIPLPIEGYGGSVLPLPVQDFKEAIKEDGALRGSLEALPSIFGIGTQTYKGAAEKPTTHAEKLARRFIMRKLPDEARDQEEIDTDQGVAQLRARSRRGEDVSADIAKLRSNMTEKQVKGILAARNKTRFQEDVNRLGARDAIIVYSVATPAQQEEIKELVQKKSASIDAMKPDEAAEVRQRYEALGFKRGTLPRAERQQRTERKPRATHEGYLSP